MRKITLCADDFGMNDAIDAGILTLAHDRRINATSAMSLGPTFRDNAPALRALPIPTGLHLDLTEFAPGTPASLARLHALAYTGRLDLQWLRTTISDQLDAFEHVMQHPPRHVDGHRHVHQLPGVGDMLIACLRERYADAMPKVRTTLLGHAPNMPWRTYIKAMIIQAMGARSLARLCEAQATPTFGRFWGIYDFGCRAAHVGNVQVYLQARYGQAMQDWLAHAQEGDLIMCHPADPASHRQTGPAHATTDPIAQDRMAEYAVLNSSAFRHWLRNAGVHLASQTITDACPIRTTSHTSLTKSTDHCPLHTGA